MGSRQLPGLRSPSLALKSLIKLLPISTCLYPPSALVAALADRQGALERGCSAAVLENGDADRGLGARTAGDRDH